MNPATEWVQWHSQRSERGKFRSQNSSDLFELRKPGLEDQLQFSSVSFGPLHWLLHFHLSFPLQRSTRLYTIQGVPEMETDLVALFKGNFGRRNFKFPCRQFFAQKGGPEADFGISLPSSHTIPVDPSLHLCTL